MSINERIATAISKFVMGANTTPTNLYLGAEEWALLEIHAKQCMPGFAGMPTTHQLIASPDAKLEYAGLALEQVCRQTYLAVALV